jgi:curved DNA-binding protein CbpA
MTTTEALSILSITESSISLEMVKKFYRKACKKFHPDVNPMGEKMMKIVNSAYEFLKGKVFPLNAEKEENGINLGEELNNALNSISSLKGLKVEICGVWIWVGGNTKAYKDIFKENGFFWSPKKAKWYFRIQSEKKYRGKRKAFSMDEIRQRHGSNPFKAKLQKKLK